jgi:hypothetical protein
MTGLQHENAFVIQFRSVTGSASGKFSGRVEHVASGRTARFQTIEELPQILIKMLGSVAVEDENQTPGGAK